nr:hypothetical protein [uncultured Desulfobacter sp.]
MEINGKKKWIGVKLLFLILCATITLIQDVHKFESYPPFFIYPIVSIGVFGFSIFFFRGVSMVHELSKGSFEKNPMNIISDPLPFYHIISLSSVVSGVLGTVKALIIKQTDPISFFYIAVGLPIFLSVYIANWKFTRQK